MSIFRRRGDRDSDRESLVPPPSYEDVAQSILAPPVLSTTPNIELAQATIFESTQEAGSTPAPNPGVLEWTPGPELPPHRPEVSVLIFSQVFYNAMLIIPSGEEALDTTPKYHISMEMNIFNPLNSTTTFRRGGTEAGEFVADYFVGPTGVGVVRIGEREMAAQYALIRKGQGYDWKFESWRTLRWRPNEDGEWGCYLCMGAQIHGPQIAQHQPPPPRFASRTPTTALTYRPPTLRIWRAGLEVLDEIVLSLLLMERGTTRRTAP